MTPEMITFAGYVCYAFGVLALLAGKRDMGVRGLALGALAGVVTWMGAL